MHFKSENVMPTKQIVFSVAILFALGCQVANAGAPLKGIDCKLGKNKGGGCVARMHAGTHLIGAARVKSHSNTNNN
jgi:hypothetical protein